MRKSAISPNLIWQVAAAACSRARGWTVGCTGARGGVYCDVSSTGGKGVHAAKISNAERRAATATPSRLALRHMVQCTIVATYFNEPSLKRMSDPLLSLTMTGAVLPGSAAVPPSVLSFAAGSC